jgi:hypothetical protein
MNQFKSALVVLALTLATVCLADDNALVYDGAKIQAVLASVPVVSKETGRMNLGERLASLGVSVKSMLIGKFNRDEIQSSDGELKAGDVDYQFVTTKSVAAKEACHVSTSFSLVKRGRSWLPQDRTGNFYTFNICKAPG